MKSTIVCIFFAAMILNIAWMDLPHLSKPDTLELLTLNIRKIAAQEISKKYDLHPVGIAGSMPNGVLHMLGLHFGVNQLLTKQEMRHLLLNVSHDLLGEINSHPELAEHAPIFPFKIENIKITINSHDRSGRDAYDPYIGFAVIRDGKLIYRIFENSNKIISERMISEEIESYEKALELDGKK